MYVADKNLMVVNLAVGCIFAGNTFTIISLEMPIGPMDIVSVALHTKRLIHRSPNIRSGLSMF